jgi:ferric-dicitrate binding protein FerR (iron transport regulator)
MDPAFTDPLPAVSWEAFDRYLAGEATPAEAAALEAHLRRHGTLESALQSPETYLATPGPAGDLDQAWQAMADRIAQSGDVRPAAERRLRFAARFTPHFASPFASRPRWASLAAAGVAAAGVVVMAVMTVRSVGAGARVIEQQYVTTAHQRATVTLPDGSRAVLGPQTTVHVLRRATSTEVSVVGEVLFTVTHDTRAPFIVRTHHAVTRVLGTTFSVRDYDGERSARVVVADGRVAMQAARHVGAVVPQAVVPQVVLVANTLGVVTDSGQVTVTPNVSAQTYTAWTTGQLVFQDTPIPQIVAELRRAYGVDIRVSDSVLTKQTLTWTVESERYSLTQALHELTALLDAHVVQAHGVILLVPGRREPPRPALHSPFASEPQYGR